MDPTATAAETTTAAAAPATPAADETVNTAAVDQAIDGQPAPTIDTSEYDNAILAEPSLKQRCTPLVTVADFKPAIKKDTGAIYGWEFKLRLEEAVDDDCGGQLPVGHEIPFLKVFTAETASKGVPEIVRTCSNILCALNGIVCDLKADPGLKKAQAALHALPAEKKVPGRLDTNEQHYKQWVGTVVRATLKPGKLDNSGRPQIDLQGMAAAPGSGGSVPY